MVRETRHLWVGNLPENINEERIREHFKRYGPVQSVKFLSGGVGDEGVCAAVAFVDICSAAKAHKADHRIEERLLKTTYYEPSVTTINATHYPSSGSGIHRDSSHYTPTTPQPIPHGARSPRFSTGLNEDHNSYERSSHFYESRRDENIGYNGLGGSTLSVNSGIAGGPGGMRRSYPGDRDSDFSNNGRGRVRAYPPRGHFLTNGRAEPGEYRWNNSGQYRYHSEAYTEEKIRRSQGSSPPPNITRSAIRGSRQTIPSSKRRLPTSRSGSESPSSSRSSRSSSSSSSSSSSTRSSSSRSGSLGHSSRSNSRSPRRIGNPSQALSIPILSSPNEKRACAICVKNLPPWSSDNSLKDGLFHDYKKHGKVTLVRIFGSGSDRYAIVCFKKSEDTEKALDASQDKQFFGVKIQVSPHEGLELDENEFRTAYDVELDEYHPKATRTLFIGGLDKDITVSELRTHFEPFGEIIEIDIKKQNSSTFAFCQYSDIRSVVLAVKKMDGEHLGCNRIKLGFGKSMQNRCIWVGGISDSLTDTVLCEHFSRFGTITHRNINREKGHALIAYESERLATLAVAEMRGCVLSGKKLQIDFASRECQEAFFDNLKKQEYLSPSDSRTWERRDVEKFERQRRGDGTFIARQISTQRVPSFTSTRSRSRYDGFEEFTAGRNFDEFADDSFERDLHEYAGRQRFENGPAPPTTLSVTAATTTTTTTTTTSTIKHRGFSPIRKREERSPHSPRSLVKEPAESLSPLIRPFEEHESRKAVRNRSTSDQESFHSQSPPPNKLTSPRGRTSSSRMPSHSPSTPHATSPSREVTLMEDRNLLDPRRRRPSEYKDLVVRVSDLRRPSESPIRLRGAHRIPSDLDTDETEIYSTKTDLHDPRLLRRDDPISSGDERSLEGERPVKKSKYNESSAVLFDKTHSIKRSIENYDYRPRDQSPSFRKPFESRKSLDKFKKDTNRSILSDDHIRSPPTDPRQRKTSQSGGSDVDETTSWRSRESSYVPVACDTEFFSDASPPGTPVRDEREDPPSDAVNRRPPLNHSFYPHKEKVHCSPLSLPLPKFAQQFRIHLSPRGASSSPRAAAVLRSPTFNSTSSNFNSISLEVIHSIKEADPILADTPVSPGPAVHDAPSDSEESATVSPTNTAVDLYERIKALDEKYEKWTGNSRTVGKISVTPRPNTVHENVSKVGPNRKKRIMNIEELRSQEPSAIVKSLLSKRSVFDEDSERLENVSDKYEPKPFTSVSKAKVCGNLSSSITYSLPITTATTSTHSSAVSISSVLPIPSATPLSSLPGIRIMRSSNSSTSVSGPLVIKSNISSVQSTTSSSLTISTSSLLKSIESPIISTAGENLALVPSTLQTCHNVTSSLLSPLGSDIPLSSETPRNLILNATNISNKIDEGKLAIESVITVSLDTRPTGTEPVVHSTDSKLITTNSATVPSPSMLFPQLPSQTTNISLSTDQAVLNYDQSVSSPITTDATQHDLSLKIKRDVNILLKDSSNSKLSEPIVNCKNDVLSVKQSSNNHIEPICKELRHESKLKMNNNNNLNKIRSELSNNYIQNVGKKVPVSQSIHKRRLSSTIDPSKLERRRSSKDALSSDKIFEPDIKKLKLDPEEKENKSHYSKGDKSENMLEKHETVKICRTETYKEKSDTSKENKQEFSKDTKSEIIKESKCEFSKGNNSEYSKEYKSECCKENKLESCKENKFDFIKANKFESIKENKSESIKENKSESNREKKLESSKEVKSVSSKENKAVSSKENKSVTVQEVMQELKKENKFDPFKENRFEKSKEKSELKKDIKESKSEIRKEFRKENKSEICKEINFESDITDAENKLVSIKDNKLDLVNEIELTKESKLFVFKEHKPDSCKETKYVTSKESKSELCKDYKYEINKDKENSKEFKFETNKEGKSSTNKENKYETKLNKDKSDNKYIKENKLENSKEKHDINKENKDYIYKSERKEKVRYNKKEDVVIEEKGANILNVEIVLTEPRIKKNIEDKHESLERLTPRLSSRVEIKEEKREKDKRKDKHEDKCADKFSQKAIQYEKIKSGDILMDKKLDLKKELKLELKEEKTEEHRDDKRSEEKVKKEDKDKCKSDYDRKRHSENSKSRMERKERNRIRKEKVRERDKHRSSFSHSDKDLEREKKDKSRSEKSKDKDKSRYKTISTEDRIRRHSGKHQERKELKESSFLSSPTELSSPNNYFDRPSKRIHSKQSKHNSLSSIEHDEDSDVLGNSPNFSKPLHVSSRFKELSEKSDCEFTLEKNTKDTIRKKHCSGKSDKSIDDTKSMSHSTLKPHYQKTKAMPEEDERGYKLESDEVSSDDELKIKSYPQPAKRTKQRATSSSSSSRRGRPSKNKSILDTESDSVDSDSNSETEKPKKPSYFDVTIYDGNMYDKVKARRVQSAQKQDDDAKQLEIKQKLMQHRSRRSKKAIQSPSNVIASETEDSDHDVAKKRGKARINSSSEDESFSKIRPNHHSSEESDSHFHSNKQDKSKKKLTSMDKIKSSKILPLSDITTDEDTIGLHNTRIASGTESDSDPRHEIKESRKIESDSEASETGIPKPPRPALSVGRGRAKENELKANRLMEKSSHMKSNIASEGLEYSVISEEVMHFKPKLKSGSFELANKIYSADRDKCTEVQSRDKGRKEGRMKAIFGLMSDDSDSNASPSVPLTTSELLSATTYRKGSSSSGTSFEPVNMTPPSQIRTHSGTYESDIDDDFRISTLDMSHQKLTPNLDSIEGTNVAKELDDCELNNMKEMLHDMPVVKDNLMGSSWRESADKDTVCEASRGASDSGKGSSSGVSTASSSSGSSAEELLLLESNASLTFKEEAEVSLEKGSNKPYHFSREIECKEVIAPRKDKKKKKKHKDKDGIRLHRHSKESHQNKSHLIVESTCHNFKFNSNIESSSVRQDVIVRTPVIRDKRSHSRSSRDSIEDLHDNFIEVIKDSPPLDMPIIKTDELGEASTAASSSNAAAVKNADTVNINSSPNAEPNDLVKNDLNGKSGVIFEEVVGSTSSLKDPGVKNIAETVECTTPKPSRSTISQEETLNAVAGLLACYNDYQEESSPPQPEDEPVIQSEPEPTAPMEDPADQSEEAQKAAQMLQSEMPEEDRENDREQSWDSVPHLNSSHVEPVPIQCITETIAREPELTPVVELSPKKLLLNPPHAPELKDTTIHFPDSPSSVQSEPELQIDEDEQTDLTDATCLNDNAHKNLKTFSGGAIQPISEALLSLKDDAALQLDHTHNILINQALTPQSLSPSCDGKIDDDCDKEKETDQPQQGKKDMSENVVVLDHVKYLSQIEDNSKIDESEDKVLTQAETKSDVYHNLIFHNQEIQNPIDCIDITPHNFKSELESKVIITDKKEIVMLDKAERTDDVATSEMRNEKLALCEITADSLKIDDVKKGETIVETVKGEIDEKPLNKVKEEICIKDNLDDMKVEYREEMKESCRSMTDCLSSEEKDKVSSEAPVCKIEATDSALYNQESVSEEQFSAKDNLEESKNVELENEQTELVKVSPPQRGRGRGRGRRGAGRSLETTSLSPEAPMLTRSCINTRHSKTRGRGRIPIIERDNVGERVPEQPRRSTRTKRARKHPDMVDHEETTNRRKRGGKGRGSDDMSMRSSMLSSDVYDFHDSDDEVGVSISKKGKKEQGKQTTPTRSPVKLPEENTDVVIDSNASPRKSRRLREKLTDDESAAILSDCDNEDVISLATKSRGRGRKEDEDEMTSPRKSPRNRSKAGESELDNERDPILKTETALSEVVLLQKVESSTSTHATSIPAVSVTTKAVIIPCPPNKPIVASSTLSTVSLTPVPAIYSNVSSHPVKLSIVQSAMRGVSKGTPVTCVVTSQVSTTQANPNVSLLTVASLPVCGHESFVTQPNVISSPIKAVLPIKALSTSAFKAFPNGKKTDSTSTPLVDPVTGHLTPMKMLDEGHYIPIAGEHPLSSRITVEGRDKISMASHPPAKVIRAVLPSSITVTSISNSNSNPITVVSIPSNSASPLATANRQITVANLPKGVAVATLPRGSEVSVELVSRTRPSVIPFTSANVQMTTAKGITNFIAKPQPTSHHPSHTSVNTIISSRVTATQPCSTSIVAMTTPGKMLTSNSVINNVVGSSRGAVLGVSLTHVKGPIAAKLHPMPTTNAKLVNTTQAISTAGVILNSACIPSSSVSTLTMQRASIVSGEYSSQLPASTTVQQIQPSIICANPASRGPTTNIPKSLDIRQQGSLQLPIPREEQSSPHPYVEEQRTPRQEYVALGPHRFTDPRFRDIPVEVTRLSSSASGTRQFENETVSHLASRQQYDLHAGNAQIRQGARSSTSGIPLSHVQSQMSGKGGIAHFFSGRDIGEIHKKAGTPQPLPHQPPHGPSGVGVERYLTSPPLHTPPSAHTPPPAHHHNAQRDGLTINPIVYHRVPYIVADPRTVPVYGDKISPIPQMPMDLKIIEKSLAAAEKSAEEKEHMPASGPKQLDIGSARPPTVITPHNAVSPHHLPSPHYERSTDSPQVTMMYTRRYPHFDPNLYPNRTGTPGMEHDSLPRSPVHMPFTPMQPTESHHQQRIPIPGGPPQYAPQVPPPPPHQGENYILQDYPIMWDGTLGLKNDQALVKMHFISGSIDVARGALSSRPEGPSSLIKISQRMRLEQSQLEGVARKMQMEDEHCILMALPFGRNPYDLLQQQVNLDIGFIKYLGEKRAAGIVNVFGPGSHQSAYVIHIFPPCDFANESLSRIAPELLHGIGNTSRLLVVIATC